MKTIELTEPVDLSCGLGVVRLDPSGALFLAPDFDNPRAKSDLGNSTYVVIWSGGAWCCLIGLQGCDLIIVRPSEGQVAIEGPLDRLDFRGSYDPGGLHRVEVHDLRDGGILLVHELGLARVSASALLWQQRHEDLTARVVEITDDVVWLEGENERFGYHLEHGDPRFANAP